MSIKLRNIVIDYGNSIAVNDLSLSIETGELVSLLGPSGCGKSTTLNAIAGLIQVTKGQILFDGVDMTKKAPQKRNIGLVFQNYALYPHLNVFKNIAFPLYQNSNFKKEIHKNNKLVRWKLNNVRQSGTYQKDIQFQQNLESAVKKSVKNLVHEFDKIATTSLKKIQTIADKYAVDIYGDTSLNALRSRQFIMWYDASRAFIEQQKLDFYQKLIGQFLQTFNNLKTQLTNHSECVKRIEFVFIQETKYLKIEDLPTTKNKAQGIESAVKVHKKLLKSESKSAIRLAKIAGKDLKWNVTLDQREFLVNQYQENQQVWAGEFKKLILSLLSEKNLVNNLGIDILDLTSDYLQNRQKSQIKKAVLDQQLLDLRHQIKSFRKEVKKAVWGVAQKVEITSQLKKKPSELSGGQQQRVAIARAIVKKPKVLLLDEPLSNLDAKLRATTREWIKKFQKETGITTIFVTHDQEEAMSISDRIFVINQGIIQQGDNPMEIYNYLVN
jgi:multiple sugar transport system ATP-binding protein